MAIVTNCIEYGFESLTVPASASVQAVTPSMSIYIPETADRRFISVAVQVFGRDSGNTATIFGTALNVDTFVDGNKRQGKTGSYALQTGEHYSYFHYDDVTPLFNQFFTGSQHSVGFRTNFSGSAYCNVSHKLLITYEYEEASVVTGIKTVRIPICSNVNTVGTVQGKLGSQSYHIPSLDTWLPENSKTYRNIFWEFYGRETAGSTAELQLFSRLDTDTEVGRGKLTQRANSDVAYYNIQTASISTFTTNTTHSLFVRSNVADRFANIGAVFYVTYEYDYTGSRNVMNSLMIDGVHIPSYLYASGLPTPETTYKNEIFIPDSNVELRQSGYIFHLSAFQQATLQVSAGTQSYTTYTLRQGGAPAGDYTIIHRFDSLDNSGSYGTFTSGKNTFPIRLISGTNVTHNSIDGNIILNYTSSRKSTMGKSTKSIFYLISGSVVSNRVSPEILTNWHHAGLPTSKYIIDYQYKIVSNVVQEGPSMVYYSLLVTGSEVGAGDINIDGLIPVIASPNQGLDEYGISIFANKLPAKRYPLDNSDFIDIELTRSVYYGHTSSGNNGISTGNHMSWITLTTDDLLVTGSILGYSGTGAGINVNFHRSGSGEYLFTLTTSAGGTFSGSWYDSVVPIYGWAISGSRYAGSEIQIATGSNVFTLNFSSGSAAPATNTEKSFTFVS